MTEWLTRHEGWRAYAFALSAVLLATLLRFSLDAWLNERAPLILYVGAVVFAAALGGLGPGLFATLIGLALGDMLFFEPRGALALTSVNSIVHVGVYLGTCIAVSAGGGHLRKTIKRLECTTQSLENLQANLQQQVIQRTKALEESNEALRKSERLASLGVLSAGIAHDMGNLLLPMRVHVEALQKRSPDQQSRQNAAAIAQSAAYLQQLASNLRLFAADPTHDNNEFVSLQQWCKETGEFVAGLFAKQLRFEYQVPSDLPPIPLSRAGISQVMLNLIQNAATAVGEDQAQVTLRAERNNGSVEITVQDTGPGMNSEVRARCFDPFYSTKSRGLSTGLGLSIVHGIVSEAGGKVDIQSPVPGERSGTAVIMTLPLHKPDHQRPARTAVVTVHDRRLREMYKLVLQQQGFSVVHEEAALSTRGVDLWVTNTNDDQLARARLLKEHSPHTSIIAVGEPSREWSQLGAVTAQPQHMLDVLRSGIRPAEHQRGSKQPSAESFT